MKWTSEHPRRRWGPAAAAAVVMTGLLAGAAACSSPNAVSPEVAAVYAHAPGLSPERAEIGQRRDMAILEWAAELDLTGIEDRSAAAPSASARATYGSRDRDEWTRHQDRLEGLAQGIRNRIRDGLTIDEVREYYRSNPENFAQQDALRIEVIEWEGGRAVDTSTLEIDASNVRTLQEYDDQLVAVALALNEGDEQTVDRGHGRYARLRCLTRIDDGLIPFDEVAQAAAAQLAAATFDTELAERVSARRP